MEIISHELIVNKVVQDWDFELSFESDMHRQQYTLREKPLREIPENT